MPPVFPLSYVSVIIVTLIIVHSLPMLQSSPVVICGSYHWYKYLNIVSSAISL